MHFHKQAFISALAATTFLITPSHSSPVPPTYSEDMGLPDGIYELSPNITTDGSLNMTHDRPSNIPEHISPTTAEASTSWKIFPRCIPWKCPGKKPKPSTYMFPAAKFAHFRLWYCDRGFDMNSANPTCGGTCHVWDRLSPNIIKAPGTHCIKTFPANDVPFAACDRKYGWQWASCTDYRRLTTFIDQEGNSVYGAVNTGDIRMLQPTGGEMLPGPP